MVRVTRRTAISRLLSLTLAVPLGLDALSRSTPATAFAQEAPTTVPPGAPGTGPVSSEPRRTPRHYFYSLEHADNAPLKTGPTKNNYGTEIGYAAFEDGTFVIHHNYNSHLLREEWIASRLTRFSIRDGALKVDVLGELSPLGCFALEMRHQEYKDRRYIRSYWLELDPPTQMVELGTDGEWGRMHDVATVAGVPEVRPLGEWNSVLFTAQGEHFEGWVNGVKALEATDSHFGSGRIGLVAMRMSRQPFRVRFRNLHVWEGAPPDPTTVWD